MNNYESTIKKICEKRGDNANYVWGHGIGSTRKEIWLLGFLKSKETLIAVFGEEALTCSDKMCIHEAHAWKYHARKMGYTLEEVLKYYEEYLGGKE